MNVLVPLLNIWMAPCRAITIYPSGIMIAIIARSMIPPPIPITADIDEVIRAPIVKIISSIIDRLENEDS